ncbi:MAG: iron ABC transporter permease, partial [Parasporobacterium sp.]|nr:iron ABC transporter permease [Parasporobacterium sp.]
MIFRKNIRIKAGFLLLLILMAVLLILNINSGSVKLSVPEIFRIIFGAGGNDTAGRIIWDIRLPRITAAFILGGALSVSGFLLQTFFHNPIAGPFVLGISSGAKLTVSLCMIFLMSNGIASSSGAMITAAFAGAMLSMGFVLLLSQKIRRMSLLIVCGVMIGYICSALTDFIVTFADDSNIVNLHNWSMGSFSGISWENVQTMAIACGAALITVFFLSKPISAYQLGEVYARNMGVNIRLFRMALILLSSVLSACVTAFAGPVSFVGIAVPHLMKTLFN